MIDLHDSLYTCYVLMNPSKDNLLWYLDVFCVDRGLAVIIKLPSLMACYIWDLISFLVERYDKRLCVSIPAHDKLFKRYCPIDTTQ